MESHEVKLLAGHFLELVGTKLHSQDLISISPYYLLYNSSMYMFKEF